jgi:adenosine deaminase
MNSNSEGKRSGWIDRAPKAELHLHIEGAIPLDALWELIERHGGDPSVPDRDALAKRFQYRDFPHFIEVWVWKNGFLRTYDDFRLVGEAVARDLADQKIVYAEAFFSPADFFRHGLKTQRIAEALREGLSRCRGTAVALIGDLVRDFGSERAMKTLRELHEVRDLGVIGIGLGGSEEPFPAAPFAAVFGEARRLGFHTTAHAGEADGPESVRQAIDDLHVERIGHGVRAAEDPSLVALLAEKGITLEICPTSNVCTGVVPSLEEHPVTSLIEAGVPVTINTDDPKMFHVTLAEEYRRLEDAFSLSSESVVRLMEGAIRASWAAASTKASLLAEFHRCLEGEEV